jgi:hypothetical protein
LIEFSDGQQAPEQSAEPGYNGSVCDQRDRAGGEAVPATARLRVTVRSFALLKNPKADANKCVGFFAFMAVSYSIHFGYLMSIPSGPNHTQLKKLNSSQMLTLKTHDGGSFLLTNL